MMTMVRRLFLLGLLGGGGYAGWMFWQQRSDDDTDAAPEWPPLVPPSTDTTAAKAPTIERSSDPDSTVNGFASLPTEPAPVAATPTTGRPTDVEPNPEASDAATVSDDTTLAEAMSAPDGPPPRWVDPVDGECPDGYPVKANDNSGIFHVPGGRFYDRTVPERCYANTDDATADGYRAAKS